MDLTILIGCIVIITGLTFIIGIVLWSRRTIHMIKKENLQSARDIQNKLHEKR